MGYYAAGDWYRSGDPGLLDVVGGVLKKVAGARAIPSGPARAATAATVPTHTGFKEKARRYLQKAGKAGMPGAKAIAGMMRGRRRRMNVLNPRALRKALRRAEGFTRFARRVVRITAPGKKVKTFKHLHRFRRRK